ncbi:hypothetical protein L596_009885 [Steinernema carpocapsae]|uniref:Uncharacterized protein n=1 Tax=Steinernema carpocapsae TaxID=34508 RepID=A0A4U5PGL9_STECR|nr:hypothetical protein L596_009885 [Steinernema carpocapsae]
MNSLPFLFVNSVAHSLSTNSIPEFSSIPSPPWNAVAEIHYQKRAEYDVEFRINNSGVTREIFEAGTYKEVPLDGIKSKNRRYTRIGKMELWVGGRHFMGSMHVTSQNLAIDKIFVNELRVFNVRAASKSPPANSFQSLWKIPVPHVAFSAACPEEIISYHLFKNENLATIELLFAYHELVRRMINYYKQGTMKKSECLDEEQDLDFAKKEGSSYQIQVTRNLSGKTQSVCFQFEKDECFY